MPRALLLLFFYAVLLLAVSGSAWTQQLKQMSFLTDSTAGSVGGPFNYANRVGFGYKGVIYSADGTAEGTVPTPMPTDAVPGPGGLFYYIRTNAASDKFFYYFDPATGNSTLLISYATPFPPKYTPSMNIVYITKTKIYVETSLYMTMRLYTFTPATGQVNIEKTGTPSDYFSDRPLVIFNNTLKFTSELHPPYRSVSGAPKNFYPADELGYLYFAYKRGSKTGWTTGYELWRTDFTNYQMVADINTGPGDSNPRSYCQVPGTGLFFLANPTNNASKVSLYWSDGASKSKRMVRFFKSMDSISIVRAGRNAVFIVNQAGSPELWASNGTADGTFQLPVTPVGNQLTTIGSHVFFFVATVDGTNVLYQTDGTRDGTIPVPGVNTPTHLYASSSGVLLFVDRSASGTYQVYQYNPSA